MMPNLPDITKRLIVECDTQLFQESETFFRKETRMNLRSETLVHHYQEIKDPKMCHLLCILHGHSGKDSL